MSYLGPNMYSSVFVSQTIKVLQSLSKLSSRSLEAVEVEAVDMLSIKDMDANSNEVLICQGD